MHVRKLDREKFAHGYGIVSQTIYPWQGVAEPPIYSSWCVVEPGKVARSHKHQEHESFIIVSGRGLMTVDGETQVLEAGDVVFMSPFITHELKNLDDEDLVFVGMVWEEMDEAVRLNREAVAGNGKPAAARRVLITATPPTPNGDFHVGHLSGPYLGADIHKRYLGMRGIEAAYLCGADDHQSYVATRARHDGSTPREVADRFGNAMPETLERARIRLDHFARPGTSPHHVRMTQDVFRRLWERGAIVAKDASTLFCEGCEKLLFEAHVRGRCPHCDRASGGNVCEDCGRPNDCADLGDPRCVECGASPAVRTTRRLYFPLEPYREQLEKLWSRAHLSPHLQALCQEMLADGLPEIAVSHPADWGIPVPVEGFEDQRIYVWLEMAPGFLAATRELGERLGDEAGWSGVWARGDAHKVVQFFGFDNGYFYALLFPAVFLAYDPDIRLPDAFVTNEFYRYEGSKFSTSRDHALWGRELLDRVSADAARFYLAYDGPETEQTDFTLPQLEETVRRELEQGWEPWLRELGAKLAGSFDGTVPGTGAWTTEQQRFFQALCDLTRQVATAYEAETFSPQAAVRGLCELVRRARRYGKAEQHWSRIPARFEEWRTAVALEVTAAKTLALLAAPVMPDFAARLWRDLGREGCLENGSWEEVPQLDCGGARPDLDHPYFTQ